MAEPVRSLSRPRILLVEDDEDIRQGVAELLEDSGYDIDQAENGRVAFDKLREADVLPNLILLDLMMPVMSGGELVLELAKQPRLRLIPVVVLSAHLGSFANTRGIECIPKPFSPKRLLDVVANYCQG